MKQNDLPGVVLYDGPSALDGMPIVCIASLSSLNPKTGNLIQTWIIRSDIAPQEAVKTGDDISICGQCPHRGDVDRTRSCYVNVHQAPLSVYNAYKRGIYPHIDTVDADIFKGRGVRLGAYGDPAAVPIDIWYAVARLADYCIGYTHQWLTFPDLKYLCMASVDTLAERHHAKILGWRTFRVSATPTAIKGEAVCPASAEQGHKLQCIQCKACNGTDRGRRGDIVIKVHGTAPKVSAFNAIDYYPELV